MRAEVHPPELRGVIWRHRSGGGCNNISAAQEVPETSVILKRMKFGITSFHICVAKLSNLGERVIVNDQESKSHSD